ncbi:hypothetical protein Prum_070370 [Phytohabitans rumicis]|uniref:Uncharacterized protein n=1 Tax=Phytohabitans rumicis TaxID=1076125 RepID=A0A6V8LL84_9ACTN|nr:hypothetical protein Prum_070370 [Phytohabitans rumicis]
MVLAAIISADPAAQRLPVDSEIVGDLRDRRARARTPTSAIIRGTLPKLRSSQTWSWTKPAESPDLTVISPRGRDWTW